MTVALARHTTGSAPPLLLLHPLGADARFWSSLICESDHEAWTAELGGHGSSERPTQAYSLESIADDLAAEVRDQVGVPMAVVGSSYGGIVGQLLAARHPAIVSHLLLADTVDVYPDPMRTMWADRAATVRTHGTSGLVNLTLDMWFSPEVQKSAGGPATLCRSMLLETDVESYALACGALREVDTREVLATITARTIVLCGVEDGPAFIEAAVRLAAALSDHPVVWVEGARHAAILEPSGLAARILTELVETVIQ